MDRFIVPLIVLAAYSILVYFRGIKKNKWISGFIGAEAEAVLKPSDKEYVNIGGSIGYNFTYKLSAPFKEAKGTFALVPRQSAFYMPVSLLAGGKDRFYLTLFTKEKLLGEAHAIEEKYFGKVSKTITGIEGMERERYERDGVAFVLLRDGPKVEKPLKDLLDGIERIDLLRHFCCYRDNSNFYVFMEPKKDAVKALLSSALKNLGAFMAKKG